MSFALDSPDRDPELSTSNAAYSRWVFLNYFFMYYIMDLTAVDRAKTQATNVTNIKFYYLIVLLYYHNIVIILITIIIASEIMM